MRRDPGGISGPYNAFPGLYGTGSAVTPATMPSLSTPGGEQLGDLHGRTVPRDQRLLQSTAAEGGLVSLLVHNQPEDAGGLQQHGDHRLQEEHHLEPAAAAAASGNYSLQYGLAAGATLLNGGVLGSGSAGSNNVYASEPLPRNAQAFTIATAIGNELAKVQANNETMATALSNLDTSIDALLKQAGVYGTSYPLGT